MTNERFIVDGTGTIIDMRTGENFDYVSKVCPLLNELYEENEKLKKVANERFIIDCNGIIDTWRENRDCNDKLTWKELCNTLNEQHEQIQELLRANKELEDFRYFVFKRMNIGG